MRSIGRRNIKLVQDITKDEIRKCKQKYGSIIGYPNFSGLEDCVMERLPNEIFDTWEMAEAQVIRIIEDEIGNAI